MPHLRKRHLLPTLIKRLKHSPVVAIQGVRQCGKSTLAREMIPKIIDDSVYKTFDQNSVLDFAKRNPETFLEGLAAHKLVVLDEVQKSPSIFDSIKHAVDLERKPGRFLILGSTEFSKMMRIRESLTGRLSRVRLFPMTMAELKQIPLSPESEFFLSPAPRITRRDLLKFLSQGGLPALFSVRDADEFSQRAQDWLNLTVERDALLIPTKKLAPDQIYRVLQKVATLAEPEAGRIAKSLRISPIQCKSIIEALKTLFVLHEILPHSTGSGKPRYYLCDPGLARVLGADFERQLETAFYLECLAKRAVYGQTFEPALTYFRTSKGSVIHAVVETKDQISALKIIPNEKIDERELMVLTAFRERLKKHKKVMLHALAGTDQKRKDMDIQILAWESMA